jgi:hypothetical protein
MVHPCAFVYGIDEQTVSLQDHCSQTFVMSRMWTILPCLCDVCHLGGHGAARSLTPQERCNDTRGISVAIIEAICSYSSLPSFPITV